MSSEIFHLEAHDQATLTQEFGLPETVYEPLRRIVQARIDERDPKATKLSEILAGVMHDLAVMTPREAELLVAGFLTGRALEAAERSRRAEEGLDQESASKYVLTPGVLLVTQEARAICARHGMNWADLLERYLAGDLGDWADEEARLANEQAIFLEAPVSGYYHLVQTDWIHIQTDAQRTLTRIRRDGEQEVRARNEAGEGPFYTSP